MMNRATYFKYLLFSAGVLGCFKLQAQTQLPPAKQLMVVISDNWDALKANIYCYKKVHRQWVLQFSNQVVLGGKGLGMGDGLIPMPVYNAPVKKEGDNKSPAGVFSIGTAFGYTDAVNANWIHNHYIKASDTLICVDDIKSVHYNTLISADKSKTDYNSFEHMHLANNYYQWGLFINHNTNPVIPGHGSCIFMHIWQNNSAGTAGCTAMAEPNLLRILHWIDSKKHPLLVQFPKVPYQKLRKRFGWPVIG